MGRSIWSYPKESRRKGSRVREENSRQAELIVGKLGNANEGYKC